MNASTENKSIAKTLANALGFNPSVYRYKDENNELSIALFSCTDPIDPNVRFYSTVGLSDYPTYQDGEEFPTRVEVLGAAYKDADYYPNVIGTIALYSIREKFFCSPGSVLENALTMYAPHTNLPHVLFCPPFLWPDKLDTLKFESKIVDWVLAVPITEKERQYREEYGTEGLENLLEVKGVDIFDLNRASTV
jgi:hypothetical protein